VQLDHGIAKGVVRVRRDEKRAVAAAWDGFRIQNDRPGPTFRQLVRVLTVGEKTDMLWPGLLQRRAAFNRSLSIAFPPGPDPLRQLINRQSHSAAG